MRQAFERNYDAIFCSFLYFCMSGNDIGEDAYSMGLNQWSAFLLDCEIPDNDSKTCRASDLDTCFIVANYEVGGGARVYNEWTNRPNEWTNGPMDQWTNGPMDQWTDGCEFGFDPRL